MLFARDSFYFLFLPFLLRLLPEPRLPVCPFPALDVNELLRGDVLPFVQGYYPHLCLAGATNLLLCSDWLTVNRQNSSASDWRRVEAVPGWYLTGPAQGKRTRVTRKNFKVVSLSC